MYEQLVPFKIWKHKTWCTDPVRPSGANFKESTHRIQQTWTAIIAQAASPGYVYTQYGIGYGFLNSANQTSFNDNGNPPFKPTNIPDQQNPGPPPTVSRPSAQRGPGPAWEGDLFSNAPGPAFRWKGDGPAELVIDRWLHWMNWWPRLEVVWL